MDLTAGRLRGVFQIAGRRFGDDRGWFRETFNEVRLGEAFAEMAEEEPPHFVQDNVSLSKRGVLRGLHFQLPPMAQGKLVTVLQGKVFDVIVDLRPASDTCGQWQGFELSADAPSSLWVPPGFAHGFVVLADNTLFAYKVTAGYAPALERTLQWNAADLDVTWPLEGLESELEINAKDAKALSLSAALAEQRAAIANLS